MEPAERSWTSFGDTIVLFYMTFTESKIIPNDKFTAYFWPFWLQINAINPI